MGTEIFSFQLSLNLMSCYHHSDTRFFTTAKMESNFTSGIQSNLAQQFVN